jgi:hypothetical protein
MAPAGAESQRPEHGARHHDIEEGPIKIGLVQEIALFHLAPKDVSRDGLLAGIAGCVSSGV